MNNNLFTKEEILKLFSEIKTENVSYISDTLIKITRGFCQISVAKNDNKTYVTMTVKSTYHSNIFDDESDGNSLFNELASFLIPEIKKENFKKIVFDTFK